MLPYMGDIRVNKFAEIFCSHCRRENYRRAKVQRRMYLRMTSSSDNRKKFIKLIVCVTRCSLLVIFIADVILLNLKPGNPGKYSKMSLIDSMSWFTLAESNSRNSRIQIIAEI